METGVLSRVLSKLGKFLKAEYDLQRGVKRKLESLRKELEAAHASLIEVAKVPDHELNPQVRIWADEVREASYDMEDVLDTFLVRVEGLDDPVTKDGGWIKSLWKPMTKLLKKSKKRHKIAGDIEDIHKRLKEATDRRNMFTVNINKSDAPPAVDPRIEAMHKQVEQLVGIENSRADLLSILNNVPNTKMNIVSIVGVGGLGKTTLAKAVYDQLKSEYDCKAFVPVGQNPDLVRVIKDILFELDKTKYHDIHNTGRGLNLLIKELQDFLKDNKRYFIVIDDVWDQESWKTIKLALVENNCGSRIITTTRNSEVVENANGVYCLPPLSDDNSKKLFCARVFGVNSNQQDAIPKEILQKCAGVPLAIITMASLLADKPRGQWIEVCKSIGFRDKDNKQVDDTMRILSYSFHDMPPHLKICLLYLSVYPEDYRIRKDVLIWKWVAEGFIAKKPGIGLFELGESYFNDLINRSMIQPIESDWGTREEGCHVHDMVLDLIRNLSSEQNFVALLSDDNGIGTSSSQCIAPRRLAYQNKAVEPDHITTQINRKQMKKVRSYIVCKCDISRRVPLESFELLRVLAIEDCEYVTDLGNLGHLPHLRYLGLRGTNIHVLPEQIGDLKFLQVIDLRDTEIHELPASIFRLTRLMSLFCEYFPENMVPGGFARLTSLEELWITRTIYALSKLDEFIRFVKDLGSLRELRVLVLRTGLPIYDRLQIDLVESLCNLHKIQHLETYFRRRIDADISTWEAQGSVLLQHIRHLSLANIKFSKLPSCINLSCLPYLTYLDLYVIIIDEKVLRQMGALPELRCLHLATDSTLTLTRNVSASGGIFFPKLRFFKMPFDSMIQFQLNEDGSRISFHIWGGTGALPFGSKKNDCRVAPPFAMMPNLEVLDVTVNLVRLLDANLLDDYCGNIGLEYLPSLRKVHLGFYYEHTDNHYAGLLKVNAAFIKETEAHPNGPQVSWLWTSRSEEEKEEEEQKDETEETNTGRTGAGDG